jgi:hypothetical protein
VSLEEELLALEERFWRAGGDSEFYREHLAGEALMVFPAPFGVFDREAIVASVESAPPWVDVRIEDAHVIRVGGGAVLAYRADARNEAGESYSTYAGSVYVEEGGRWTLAFHQQTPISALPRARA